jgi:hypothetical protein
VHYGKHATQIYTIHRAIPKTVTTFYQKDVDAQSNGEIKKTFLTDDRALLGADPRKMFGGQGGVSAGRSCINKRGSVKQHILWGFAVTKQKQEFESDH